MAKEIERKWLVKSLSMSVVTTDIIESSLITQGYLYSNEDMEVRIRKEINEEASYKLTIKFGNGLVRRELETEISEEFYEQCKADMNDKKLIKKKYLKFNKCVDGKNVVFEYSGVNAHDFSYKNPFCYLEVEFESEEEANNFDITKYIESDLIIKEVTYDDFYKMKNIFNEINKGE